MGSCNRSFLWSSLFFYESQPVGLAEVIDASEASLGGPGGRPLQMSINRVVRVMYQVAIG